MQTAAELSDRHRRLLALVVREYIEHGEPVSSLWLTRRGGVAASSATVRNLLAKLEEWGYLHQPHTSAGRVPTDLGYRCYVDRLLQARRPARSPGRVEALLREAGTVDDVLSNASHELFKASHHLGFAMAPEADESMLREIQFVSLGASKVLVVVVSSGGQISHKVVDLGESTNPDELRQSATYLNSEFSGMPLASIREAVLERLREERHLYDTLRARAFRLARSTFEDLAATNPIFIQGAASLIDEAQEAYQVSRATVRALIEMIEEKSRLVRLLNEYIEGPGLTIVIGAEHTTPDLRKFSLVASTYFDGRRIGTVGVIGPTRMRYSRAIAAVDVIAGAVSRALVPPDKA